MRIPSSISNSAARTAGAQRLAPRGCSRKRTAVRSPASATRALRRLHALLGRGHEGAQRGRLHERGRGNAPVLSALSARELTWPTRRFARRSTATSATGSPSIRSSGGGSPSSACRSPVCGLHGQPRLAGVEGRTATARPRHCAAARRLDVDRPEHLWGDPGVRGLHPRRVARPRAPAPGLGAPYRWG